MTYAMASALQKAVFETLQATPALTSVIGDAIYDSAPPGALPSLFVTLGLERATAAHDSSGVIVTHRFTVSVISQDDGGFARAKRAAGAVSDALDGAVPVLEHGRVLGIAFARADARRMPRGGRRRIDLRFTARLESL